MHWRVRAAARDESVHTAARTGAGAGHGSQWHGNQGHGRWCRATLSPIAERIADTIMCPCSHITGNQVMKAISDHVPVRGSGIARACPCAGWLKHVDLAALPAARRRMKCRRAGYAPRPLSYHKCATSPGHFLYSVTH